MHPLCRDQPEPGRSEEAGLALVSLAAFPGENSLQTVVAQHWLQVVIKHLPVHLLKAQDVSVVTEHLVEDQSYPDDKNMVIIIIIFPPDILYNL